MALIPIPARMNVHEGVFRIQTTTAIVQDQIADSPIDLGAYLAECLRQDLGIQPSVQARSGEAIPNAIVLRLDPGRTGLGDEGYRLTVAERGVEILARQPAGLFYGIQTLRQLAAGAEKGAIPRVTIEDAPLYPWRGLLLDCARHFLEQDFIKRYIDLMAYHKLNRLHLHLTDDQGWRIEIKKYPKLTETGAWRDEGGQRYGGFYTQAELKEIVEYARKRFITVVPEFEMPGHATAAAASYPDLLCRGEAVPVQTEWGIFPDVFCPGKESTFEFLEGVLDEITEIFPSAFIHIGGDEAPRDRWKECPHCQQRMKEKGFKSEDELQGYLIERVARFLSIKDRRLIGWDEILDVGGLPKTAVVQSWRGMAGAVRAAQLGHDVISSPNGFVYFDYPQDAAHAQTKPDWMQTTTLEKVYQFQPTPPELTAGEAKRVWGAECTMWSEHAPQEKIDEQLFPRVCAFTEVLWSPPERRSWEDFQQRLKAHYGRLEKLGVKYYRGEN
ncbi:MAG: beta-N-acetylhexosaminidase [bacterium]